MTHIGARILVRPRQVIFCIFYWRILNNMGTSHPYKRLIIKISYSPRVLPESPMRDSNIVWLIFGPRKDKHHIFILNLLKLVYGHTSLGYKGLNIDPFLGIENLLRNYNFPKDIFCIHQNKVFIYRYSAVGTGYEISGSNWSWEPSCICGFWDMNGTVRFVP